MAGRPTKYEKKFDDIVFNLALLGANDKQLAASFRVAKSTIRKWIKEYPSFSDSVYKGRVLAESDVTRAMYEKAKGYEYKEVTKEYSVNHDKTGLIKQKKLKSVKVTKKRVAPDPRAAQVFIMQKDRWLVKNGKGQKGRTAEIIIKSECNCGNTSIQNTQEEKEKG